MYEPLQLLEVSDLTWPVAYRFHLSGPFGGSQQELCVNAPSLVDNLDATKKLGGILFAIGIAPAMSVQVQCDFVECVPFKVTTVPIVYAPQGLQGGRFTNGLGRASAGVLCLHSGHHDRYAMRRLYAAGMPHTWASDGILTTTGAEKLQELARGWIGGASVEAGAGDPQLLIRHRQAVPRPGFLVDGDGFRYVRHIRVCQYTSPVPEPGDLLWP